MVLLIYEAMRLRSMSLIHQDDLVLVGGVGQGGVGQGEAGQMMPLASSVTCIATSVCEVGVTISSALTDHVLSRSRYV